MLALDAFSLTLSVLGIYSLVLALRYLIPCYTVPCLWARLNEAKQLLNQAEEIDAIPPESDYRAHLNRSENQFAEMRLKSNDARGPFQQLRLAIQHGLTCQLYVLYYRIECIKSNLEAIDREHLRIAVADSESATRTAVPSSAAATATASVVVPTPSMVAFHPLGGVVAAAADVVVLTPALAAMIISHPSAPTATPVNDVVDPIPALLVAPTSP